MVELENIYSHQVLELAANIPRVGRLEDPHGIASVYSKLCGSRITVTLKMEGDTVTDYAQDVRACLLGQTSAAVMGANIVGTTVAELREVRGLMHRMLREGGEPPGGRWADLAILESVRYYKARHASALLVFEAVEEAISAIEKDRAE
jgi:NifU-like protein involved in Fe-S cluster formation